METGEAGTAAGVDAADEVAPPKFAIPESGNEALQALLNGVKWPQGWGWYKAKLQSFTGEVSLAHVPGMERAKLWLAHRTIALPTFAGAVRAGDFALLLKAEARAPAVTELEQALVDAFGAAGASWDWVEVEPEGVASPKTESDEKSPSEWTGPAPEPIPEGAPSADALAELLALAGVAPTRFGGAASAESVLESELEALLELRPFVDPVIRFDPAAMLAEARALLDRFVPYQSDEAFGIAHWKGLALWGFDGDERRPAMPVGPDSTDGSRYGRTAIADACPETMRFLAQHLDLSRARTIAFLALDPGATIAPHTDDDRHEVALSFNAALNMPEGCEFLVGLDDDGREGPRTVKLPLHAGSALVVNVGTTHLVRNTSDELRIHLVARAPLKMPVGRLVDLAREQSGVRTREALDAAIERLYEANGWAPPVRVGPGEKRPRHERKA